MPLKPVLYLVNHSPGALSAWLTANTFVVANQRRFLAKPLGEWQIAESQPEAQGLVALMVTRSVSEVLQSAPRLRGLLL